MKSLSYALLASTLCYPLVALAGDPQVIPSPVKELFVPRGFDNNDNIEVIVTGSFPNPCFIKNKVEVTLNHDRINVEVTALDRDDRNSSFCEPLEVPYKETITIGNLQGGDYKLIINEGTQHELKETFEVSVSTSESVDDHLYALVDYVELGFTGGVTGDAMLMTRIQDCLEMDRVEYLSNGKNTFSILPILRRTEKACSNKWVPSSIPVKINPSELTSQKILLFVRTMDGKSVNTLIEK